MGKGGGAEGFRSRTRGGDLVLAGKDGSGIRFAVRHLLEQEVGIRWFWPGESGGRVPAQATIRIGDLNLKEEPGYQMRILGRHSWKGEGGAW